MRKLISIIGVFLAMAVVLPMLITLTYGGSAKSYGADFSDVPTESNGASEPEETSDSPTTVEPETTGKKFPELVYDYAEDADRYYAAEPGGDETTVNPDIIEPIIIVTGSVDDTSEETEENVSKEETTVPEPETTVPKPETTVPEPETTVPKPETTAPYEENDRRYTGCDSQIITVYLRSEKKYLRMSIGDYLVGVVIAEMPLRYDDEALKAQAVASRTFTLYRMAQSQALGITSNHGSKYADICTYSGHCQAYLPYETALESWNDEKYTNEAYERVKEAVLDTSGIVVTYKGEVIEALYHASSYEKTDSLLNVWGGTSKPYLVGTSTPEKADTLNVASKRYFTVAQMKKYVLDINAKATFTEDPSEWVEDYTLNNNERIESYRIGGVELSGTAIRAEFALSSTYFRIIYNEETQRFVFSVFGWGHGVGMSQYGAGIYADNGYSCEYILKHYYTGTELERR